MLHSIHNNSHLVPNHQQNEASNCMRFCKHSQGIPTLLTRYSIQLFKKMWSNVILPFVGWHLLLPLVLYESTEEQISSWLSPDLLLHQVVLLVDIVSNCSFDLLRLPRNVNQSMMLSLLLPLSNQTQQKISCSLVLKLKKRSALYFQVLTGALHTVYHESRALF